MNDAPLLTTNGLTKRFGGHAALSRLNLAVGVGEIRCLIGPNGAGKSTALALLSGTIRPSAGEVVLKGTKIENLPSYVRARLGIGIKFQIPSIFADLTVAQNLKIALETGRRNIDVEGEIDRTLGFLDLGKRKNLRAGSLSHGEKQWLELGLAIATKPDLLLLDEPTAGMTPEETRKTGEILLELNRSGVTIIAVEHDMAFVRQIAHRISVLHLGRLFFEGTVNQVMTNRGVANIYFGNVE